MNLTDEARQDLIRRLRRIEGQAQGIQRMLEEGRDCREVLNQLASVRAATQSASAILAKQYALACLLDTATHLAAQAGGEASPLAESPEAAQRAEDVIEFLLRLPG